MVESLTLENFRNYKHYSLKFAKTTIFIGLNGIGKTNIIEALFLISTGRSWRTKRDNEVVRWGTELAKINLKVTEPKEVNIEMIIQAKPSENYPMLKIIKVNGLKKKLADLLGRVPSVLFSPEEIQMIEGAPNLRRRFLDILLCQIDKKYTLALLDLNKIIRGRNRLLYFIKIGRSDVKELAFWDQKLITLGGFIIKKRLNLVEALNNNLTAIYQDISGTGETLKIKYKGTVKPDNFALALQEIRQREIDYTATLLGPHRDDLVVLLEGRDLSSFGSRGEYRSAVLALKMAELEYLKAEKPEHKPILLLDDIFSELDFRRRLHLGKIIENQQTIITTTDLDHIDPKLRQKATIIDLKEQIPDEKN